jgi:segregation and condensation protein B
MDLAQRIEAVLFYKGEPVAKRELSRILSVSDDEITAALQLLRDSLLSRGLRILETGEEAALVTAPELTETLEQIRKEELKRDIGKAGAETLSIILYRGPVTRTDIDYVRGVNSSFILRNLLMRGLIERSQNPKDARTFVYDASPELLQMLGVTNRTELPEYADILAKLDQFENERLDEPAEELHTASPA